MFSSVTGMPLDKALAVGFTQRAAILSGTWKKFICSPKTHWLSKLIT